MVISTPKQKTLERITDKNLGNVLSSYSQGMVGIKEQIENERCGLIKSNFLSS